MGIDDFIRRDTTGMPDPERLSETATLSELIEQFNVMVDLRQRDEAVAGPQTIDMQAPEDAGAEADRQALADDDFDSRISDLEAVHRAQPISEPQVADLDIVGVSGNDTQPDWLSDKLPSFDGESEAVSYKVVGIDKDGNEIDLEVGTGQVQRLRLIIPNPDGGTGPTAFQHNLISSTHTDTSGVPVQGDLIYIDSGGGWTTLTIGSPNQVITSDGTDLSWKDSSTTEGGLVAEVVHATIRKTISLTAGTLSLSDTDFRGRTFRFENSSDVGTALGIWANALGPFGDGHVVFTALASPLSDEILWSNAGNTLSIDKDDGHLKYSWTTNATEYWIYIRLVLFNAIPDYEPT